MPCKESIRLKDREKQDLIHKRGARTIKEENKKQAAERVQRLVKMNYEECNQYIQFNYCSDKKLNRKEN